MGQGLEKCQYHTDYGEAPEILLRLLHPPIGPESWGLIDNYNDYGNCEFWIVAILRIKYSVTDMELRASLPP